MTIATLKAEGRGRLEGILLGASSLGWMGVGKRDTGGEVGREEGIGRAVFLEGEDVKVVL